MIDALRGLVQWTPLGLPAFLFVITVVVFFHELGHFLVARAFGVKVDVFSIGFGKEIVGFNDRRGTRWRVSWLPIGGYVKFSGDANAASAPDSAAVARMSPEMRTQTLALKPVGQRALVAAAGPFANFILAIVMLTGLLLYSGHVIIPPVVGFVAKDSPAGAAGIKPGDRVTAIDGDAITDFQQLPQIISMSGGENLAISLERQGHSLTVHAVPHLVRQKNMLGEWESSFVIGIGGSSLQAVIQPYTPLGAFQAACGETWDIISTTLTGVVKMAQGHASADQVQGAIGIGKITQKVAEFGFLPLLNLVAILSVSIGLANLFPIPLLDGGHLLYYACEAVLRRPLGERAQELGFRFGVVLVVGLLVVSAIHDLSR
ncbi:MAG TPA: M50 family metallopeptidase [Rhizomicrobium sp.]|jgi:regulator of sigma E protease|nr:M50 family metallopeptidase [Rhizomicrobium sp.]